MEELLCDAALKGDIELLHEIMNKDFFILYKVCVGSFKGKNPLHVAISTGQREFVLKLLEIKPDLAEVLDPELGAALHVASAKENVEIVKALVTVSPGMCLARDRDGNNPLHIAAIKGQVQVLDELIRMSPRRAQVKTDGGDTILHLCVKYYQFQCLELLQRNIQDQEFVNAGDTDGNTILHLVVSEKQLEMIKYVLSNSKIKVNAKNKSGQTALDIHFLAGENPTGSVIQERLLNAGAKTSEETITEAELLDAEPKWQSKRRNALLIVASLIATMTFQVGVNPPGGVFQDDSIGAVGTPILRHTDPSSYFNVLVANTIGLLVSLSTILLLIFAMPVPEKSHRMTRFLLTWFTILAILIT